MPADYLGLGLVSHAGFSVVSLRSCFGLTPTEAPMQPSPCLTHLFHFSHLKHIPALKKAAYILVIYEYILTTQTLLIGEYTAAPTAILGLDTAVKKGIFCLYMGLWSGMRMITFG